MSTIVSANEAAHRFGLSEKTVRRWIAAGKLKADKHGRAYRVDLSEVAALSGQRSADNAEPTQDTVQIADTGSAPSTTGSRSVMSGIVELVALVDRLQAENRDLAAAAALWQERARVLGDQLALTAPQSPPDASGTPEPPAEATRRALRLGGSVWARRWATGGESSAEEHPQYRERGAQGSGSTTGAASRSMRFRSTLSSGVPPLNSVAGRQPITS
jgi:excisionase family DNA binding protein